MEQKQDTTTELVVENELLTNEVHRLRSKVTDLEQRLAAHQAEVRRLLDDVAAGANPGDLERQALQDLRYLIGKVEGTPLARVLRRKAGYRAIVERYRED